MPMFADLSADPGKPSRPQREPATDLPTRCAISGTETKRRCTKELARLSMPMLVMAGANDVAFVAHAQEICRRASETTRDSRPSTVALHAAPFVQPEAFFAALANFLGPHDAMRCGASQRDPNHQETSEHQLEPTGEPEDGDQFAW